MSAALEFVARPIPPERAHITVGSSQVGPILGLGMWQDSTPMSVWGRMIGLIEDRDNDSKARGDIIETALLLWWEKHHGNGRTLTRCASWEEAPAAVKDGWKRARWDGLIPHKLIVEAKTTRSFDEEDGWGDDGTNQVPACYQAQLAWQMHVLDVPEAELVAFSTLSDEVRRYHGIKRHPGIEHAVVSKIQEWMERHVWTDEWCPPGATTYEITSARFRNGGQDDKEWIEPRQQEIDLAKEYSAAHEREKAAKADKERIKNLLCERIGDAYGIQKVATWAHGTTPAEIDTAKLLELFPAAHAACLVPGKPTRRFNLKWKDPDASEKAAKGKSKKET